MESFQPTTININHPMEAGGPDMSYMCEYIAMTMKKKSQQKMLAQLSLDERKRLRALRKLQFQQNMVESEFHRMVYELEKNYQEKYAELYKKRADIINGTYEPNEEECEYSDVDLWGEEIEELDQNNEKGSGIENFWLNIFKYVPFFDSMVAKHDEAALKHLQDVTCHMKPLPELAFVLEFHFSSNEFFENPILTKEYVMKCEPDMATPLLFDGPEIYKCFGCKIDWKEGKDLTTKIVKQITKSKETNTKQMDSFFNFFNPPPLPTNAMTNDEIMEKNNLLEHDFEIGNFLKERIIPRAVLFYTGEIEDDDDDIDTSSGSSYNIDNEEAEPLSSGSAGGVSADADENDGAEKNLN